MKSSIGEYTILPLAIPPLPSFPEKHITHTLYIRPHAPKIPTEDDARSLFVVNVPIDATVEHFKAISKELIGAGRFEGMVFDGEKRGKSKEGAMHGIEGGKKRKRGDNTSDGEDGELPKVWDRELRSSGSSAVVRFVDGKSMEGFLKAVRKIHKSVAKTGAEGAWPIWGNGVTGKIAALGTARYQAHHRLTFPDPKALQHSIDAFMTSFNQKEVEEQENDKRRRNEPDEDGFITVSKSSRAGVVRREVAEMRLKEAEEKERKKREELEKRGFYRFQGREKRKREEGELKAAFEVDRKRVEEMKSRRGRGGFVPEG